MYWGLVAISCATHVPVTTELWTYFLDYIPESNQFSVLFFCAESRRKERLV